MRANSNARGYTAAWRRIRRLFLMVNPVCIECGQRATVVDHVDPHKGNKTKFWAVGNWRPMCAKHHSRATVLYDGGWGRPVRAKP